MNEKLVVRLSGNGQYEIDLNDDFLLKELNDLDNEIVALLAQAETKMQELLQRMAAHVELRGSAIDGVAISSGLVLPPLDLTLREAAELFGDEGLIPGSVTREESRN